MSLTTQQLYILRLFINHQPRSFDLPILKPHIEQSEEHAKTWASLEAEGYVEPLGQHDWGRCLTVEGRLAALLLARDKAEEYIGRIREATSALAPAIRAATEMRMRD
jgi:hypothetical protein